jgi:ADP-ribosyl-[dinitrogen reductase] hydrolase
METQITHLDRSLGCLLAGAVGDALGAPVEFMDRHAIVQKFGTDGIRDYAPAYGGIGKITDDTQMTLFTAEGCLRALAGSQMTTAPEFTESMRQAYIRWLLTQGVKGKRPVDRTGWLINNQILFSRRAPGNTCLSALQRIGGEKNNSKGCGGIMRVAPCGILHAGSPKKAFDLGVQAAKLTHGHPTGYLAAGVLAAIIAEVMVAKSLAEGAKVAREIVMQFPGHEETVQAIDRACDSAHSDQSPEAIIPMLGEGWVAEEALAISLYCALSTEDLEEGIIRAVNITGDSDSTGAITGNLLGAMYGRSAIPQRWLNELELREVIETMANDLSCAVNTKQSERDRAWMTRYCAM